VARFALLCCLVLAACSSPPKEPPVSSLELATAAEKVLDQLHALASAADEERYFALFARDGVFLGTDATERWTVEQFRAYAHPHFSQGKGWTYSVKSRNLAVDPSGGWAWFDELLENAKLGTCRGTGALRREQGGWKIVQYDLTIPIPNDLAEDFAARIKDHAQQR
jgi:hypothetical protein